MNDIELLKIFDRKDCGYEGDKLLFVKYYHKYDNESCIFFDVEHETILMNTKINNIKELDNIISIGKELDILKKQIKKED